MGGRENRIGFAVSLMLVAFLCFASMDTIAKLLVVGAMHSLQVAFIRFLVHFSVVVVYYYPQKGNSLFKSEVPHIQFLRAIALLGSTIFNFTALIYLPLTVTTAIFFASPLVVCLLSIKVLNEKVGIRRLGAVFVGFIGVMIITQAWNANFHWAMFLSLGALISASTYFVLTRKIAGKDDNAIAQTFASGISALALAPFAISLWVMPATIFEWVLLLMIGILGAVGHSVLTLAHQFAEASKLAPLIYVQIIYVTILSWLIFNALPDFWTLVGTGIIASSGVYLWSRERLAQSKLKRQQKQPTV